MIFYLRLEVHSIEHLCIVYIRYQASIAAQSCLTPSSLSPDEVPYGDEAYPQEAGQPEYEYDDEQEEYWRLQFY